MSCAAMEPNVMPLPPNPSEKYDRGMPLNAPMYGSESLVTAKVPAQLRTDLNQIEQGIIAGTIKITSSSQPAP